MLSASPVRYLAARIAPALLAVILSYPTAPVEAEGSQPIPVRPRSEGMGSIASVVRDPDFQRRFAESYIAETDIEPRVTEEERTKLQEALKLIGEEKMDAAAAMIEKELARDGAASAVMDFTLANIRFQQDRLSEAATAYRTALDKYSKFRRAWKNLGIIYVREGRFDKAIEALVRVIELGGGDAVTYGILGFAYATAEQFLPAESAYRTAVMLDPATRDWKMGLARCLFKQERYPEAAALCGQMLEAEPERADLWLLQANAFIGQGRALDAARNYEILSAIGGATPDSLNILGDIYVNQELYQLAADSYARAIKSSGAGGVERGLSAAKVLAARGALDQTRRLVAEIESHSGNDISAELRRDILKVRARLVSAEGAGGDEEARILEEIVELDPLDGEALILLGRHAQRGGDAEKAAFYYERAAGIEAFEADAKVRHAQLLVSGGKYTEAVPLLRRAQQLNPRDNVQKYLQQVERLSRGQ